MVTTLNKMTRLLSKTTTSITQFERPQEIIRLLEMRPNSDNLMDEVFDADDPKLAKGFFNHGIVREGNTLMLHFAITSLVDELTSGLHTRVAVCVCVCACIIMRLCICHIQCKWNMKFGEQLHVRVYYMSCQNSGGGRKGLGEGARLQLRGKCSQYNNTLCSTQC